MYERIAAECKKKKKLEKQLQAEMKEKAKNECKTRKARDNSEIQKKKMAEYQLQSELKLQNEEADRRSLVSKMMCDAKANNSSFNGSSLNVLKNFQGTISGIKRFSEKNVFNELFFRCFYLLKKGALNNMKRNQVKFHDSLIVLIQDKQAASEERKKLLDTIQDLKHEIRMLNLHRSNEIASVADIFPLQNQRQIVDFMSNSDGNFQARMNGFYEYLFSIRAPTKKKFKEELKTHLFSHEYMVDHYWPNVK